MRKYYIRPEIEVITSQFEQGIMAGHSNDWADAKGNTNGFGGGHTVIERGHYEDRGRNLWED